MSANRQSRDTLARGGSDEPRGRAETSDACTFEEKRASGETMVGRARLQPEETGWDEDPHTRREAESPAERGRKARGGGWKEGRATEAEPCSDTSVRNLFLRRVNAWSRSLAESAPAAVLADALAYPSARSSILHVLDVVPATEEKTETEVLQERALQRALSVREELAREAGGMRSTQWVANHLNVKRQSVDRYRTAGKLLAGETPQGYVFPACQFDADGIVPGLPEVLEAMRRVSFWEALSGLLTPTPALGGRSVLEALRTAGPEEQQKIREVAHAYASE